MRDEAAALLKYQPYFAQKSVLDIGIGAGRTTVYIEPLAKEYVGIDFSPTFISYVNHVMPRVSAKLCDMRDLGEFGPDQFDFVMASFNVLDFASHEDRLKTLAEVHRVLKSGGVFIFSSHNRAYEMAGSRPRMEMAKDPLRQVRQVFRTGAQWRNYLRWKKDWIDEADYAIVADVGNNFSTLHYYIDHDSQRRQLQKNGFSVLDVFDIEANPIAPGSSETGTSAFLTYVAQKQDVEIGN